jgi:hypothetical protein
MDKKNHTLVMESRIDMRDVTSIDRWCRVLNVDKQVLEAAVAAAGSPSISAVLRYLNRGHPRVN